MKRVYRIISTIVVMMLLFSCFAFAQDEDECSSADAQIIVLELSQKDCITDAEEALSNIQQNKGETSETAIKDITALLFQLKIDELANPDKPFQDYSIFWDQNSINMNNLEYFVDNVKAKKLTLNTLDKRYNDIRSTLSVEKMIIGDNYAIVEVYEWFEFFDSEVQAVYSSILSGEGTDYTIDYILNDDGWYITNIDFYDESTNALKKHEMSAEELAQKRIYYPDTDKTNENEMVAGDGNIINSYGYTTYINTNKVKNYARQYSSNASGTGSYNSNFMAIAGNDCQNFASQSIWYGLGGADDSTSINNKYWPMVASGPYSWYGTKYAVSAKWSYCGDFGSLIANTVANREGPHGLVYSGISKAQVGDIIQYSKLNNSVWDHSFVVVAVTGTYGSRTASNITVCAHTNNRKDVLLSNYYVNSYTYRTIHVTYDWRATDTYPIT
ncbi:MAG: amidase domain-containing protein [Firmicutes bacterium]|nr:amidase domain-containing protein [Bacillota bacterium]MBQ1735436.1 amidase domain-containing protein [Lachnospiraceae bacterium]